MTKKQKKALARILTAGCLLALCVWLPVQGLWRLPLFLLPYLLVGGDVLLRAGRNIAHGQVFDENFLMSVATLGALVIGEYPEAVAVMLFYQVGELFQRYAVGKSRRNIAQLMDIRPDSAELELADGGSQEVDPAQVPPAAIILVRPGAKVPLDGEVLEGNSMLDTSALTGESLPREVSPGAQVLSGCINKSGLLRVRVTKPFGESTVAKILDLVENAGSRKAKAENFITKFARYYTPAVVSAALALAVLPPLLGFGPWLDWITRALNFLVVSCPCALVISIPLSFFGGIGGASRQGILVKGGNYLEALAAADIVAFDKTGTLTKGSFSVTQVHPAEDCTREALLEHAALAECYSAHPIALSLREAWGNKPDPARVTDVQEIAGQGVSACVDGQAVWAGNERLLQAQHIPYTPESSPGTVVYVAAGQRFLGSIVIADSVKPDAAKAIRSLRAAGIRRTVMLTGDSPAVAQRVAQDVGVDEVQAGLLPDGKVAAVERLLQEKRGALVFVGDGINDAPVLARADIGVAMGGLGSDAAIEAADVVLMDDKPSKLAAAVAISRKTLAIVRQNITFALAVKGLVLLLSALGMANMWEAVFADVGVAVLAILNAMRALRTHAQPLAAPAVQAEDLS